MKGRFQSSSSTLLLHFLPLFYAFLVVEFIPATANGTGELLGAGDMSLGEVSGRNLGLHLDLRVWGDQLIGDLAALQDLDTRIHDRVVLHVGHGHEPVNLGHT